SGEEGGDGQPTGVDPGGGDPAVAQALALRDRADTTRAASPLAPASDAVVVDTTGRPVEELIQEILGMMEARTALCDASQYQAGGVGAGEDQSEAGEGALAPAPAPLPSSSPAAASRGPGGRTMRQPRGGRRPTPKIVPPTRPARWFYAVARAFLMGLSKALWQASVSGTERVPRSGPFIVSPVHRSNIDTILMGFVTRKRLCYLAKDSLWESKPLGFLVSALGGFPVHRGAADREALRRCIEVLRSGQSLVVFPEGARRSGPVVEKLYEGAAYLSLRTGAPIVPVGIGGSEGALPKGSRLPQRVRVHIIVGHPIPSPTHAGGARVHRQEVNALTTRLQAELQELLNQAQAAAQNS
ncbi:MAG: 1-acyl-sn-glycerol-3-phosphate acyltransferase, partial [Acidimicrobiales bacterium]